MIYYSSLDSLIHLQTRQGQYEKKKKKRLSSLPLGENSLTNKFIFTSDLMNLDTGSTVRLGEKKKNPYRWPFKCKCTCKSENSGKINN